MYIYFAPRLRKTYNNCVSDKLNKKKEMTTFKELESRSDSGNNPYIKALITLTKNDVLRLK